MPTFRWALLSLIPAQPSGNLLSTQAFFLLSSSWDLLLFKGICLQAPYYADSFFLSHCLLFLLSSFYIYWVSFLPFYLLFLVFPSQLEDAQIHLDTVSVPQMFSLGNAVGIHLQNNFSKCFGMRREPEDTFSFKTLSWRVTTDGDLPRQQLWW